MSLQRLLPLLVAVGVGVTQADEIDAVIELSLDMARIAVAKVELSHIKLACLSQSAESQDHANLETDLTGFIRATLSGGDGDPALDPWGNPYLYHRGIEVHEIYSRGPDGIAENEDDLWTTFPRGNAAGP